MDTGPNFCNLLTINYCHDFTISLLLMFRARASLFLDETADDDTSAEDIMNINMNLCVANFVHPFPVESLSPHV